MSEFYDYSLLSVKELRQLIGCGRNKMYEILATNTMPTIKIGKQYYVPRKEYEKWVNRNLNSEIRL
ncbi:MAG: helix-turn-helix domain-containing protein [Oscillospiraceae bacterium]|nr:helix-turn-helix domain-containing protein [Oscillospiraceae bacterium]